MYLAFQINVNAQVHNYRLDEIPNQPVFKKSECEGLRPVYFNFSRRRLYNSNNMPLNGNHFLELCRGINDPQVQHQLRKYDQLTHNKKKLLVAMIVCGVGGYVGLMGSASMLSSSGNYNKNGYTVLGISAASLFIATPILAISTGIPHQKRKEILFRDLPDAYNFYVLSQPNP